MDARFDLVKRVPTYALKQINAGRLRGKTDVSPMWRTMAMTECYGMCGIGWKYEVANIDKITTETGEVALFMQVNLYIKDKETGEWSAPIIGFGGDFIVKKEREGARVNDESYKMCLTDALGNAMKQVGVAADIFLGLFDGSKYTNVSDVVTVQDNQEQAPQPAYKQVDGKWNILARNGQYYPLSRLSTEQLNSILNDSKYNEIHTAVFQEMATRNE